MSSQVLVPGGGRRPAPTLAMKVEPDAAAFAVFESELAPGAPGPAPHRHLVDDEAFYVLAGSVAFLLDGEVTTCGPGSCVLVPRGVAHGFGNPSAEPARVLVVTTPAPPGWSRACTPCGAGVRGPRRSPTSTAATTPSSSRRRPGARGDGGVRVPRDGRRPPAPRRLRRRHRDRARAGDRRGPRPAPRAGRPVPACPVGGRGRRPGGSVVVLARRPAGQGRLRRHRALRTRAGVRGPGRCGDVVPRAGRAGRPLQRRDLCTRRGRSGDAGRPRALRAALAGRTSTGAGRADRRGRRPGRGGATGMQRSRWRSGRWSASPSPCSPACGAARRGRSGPT